MVYLNTICLNFHVIPTLSTISTKKKIDIQTLFQPQRIDDNTN